MEAQQITGFAVNASYRVLVVKKNVLIKVPSAGDPHLKWMKPHNIKSLNGFHAVKEHYRRGDIFGGRFVTRRLFISPEFIGEEIIATVKVVEKTDYQKKGERSLILEIYLDTEGPPTSRLKVGASTGDYPIPGVPGRFIKFEKI